MDLILNTGRLYATEKKLINEDKKQRVISTQSHLDAHHSLSAIR